MTDISARDAQPGLPQGTVTFLFTDIEGSTTLLQRLGDDYGHVLATHRALLRDAFATYSGREVDTQGDAFFVAFRRAEDAVAAAAASQRALLQHPWGHGEPVLVRMGIHTGEPVVVEGHYVGIDVHRAARICSAAHGGQIVISDASHRLLDYKARGHIDFKDLGVHRLKDLDHPERILQLIADGLPRDFPPLRSLTPPTNVPHGVGSLVGRRKEIHELKTMLLGGDARAVTITGPGGIGKTRVAAAVALDVLDHFVNGVYFVDLSATLSADLVASAIAGVLGIPLDDGTAASDAIARYISDKQMLLVLDNFEQALDGAAVVSALLHACPRLSALVTSRIALSIQGEHEYPLSPLGLPANSRRDAVEASDAGRLFVKRATEARPGFSLDDSNAAGIAQICELLDGLPLAIELAAARVKLFSPEALLGRLHDRFTVLTGGAGDRPKRHRTLRRTIDWSHELLSADERPFFRDFAVFHGGATFDAVDHVIDGEGDALDAVSALVGHSLVRRRDDPDGEARFAMLATIREYALEQLEADAGYSSLRERHASYYLRLAHQIAEQETTGPAALDRIGADHDNMRAALTWWSQQADEGSAESATHALQLATALGRYWYTHGHVGEGGGWLERALTAAPAAPDELRAHAIRLLGVMMDEQGHLERARELFAQALAYFRRSGDRAAEASCLNSLGVVARSLEDLDAAEELFEASASLRRALGDETGTASSLGNLGIVAIDRGDFDRAEELFEDTLTLDRARGDDWGIAVTLTNLGVVHLERGDFSAARDASEDALRRFEATGDADGTAETIENLAGLAARENRPARAARLAGAADALRRSVGIPLPPVDRARLQRWLDGPRRTLGDDGFERAWREGAEMTTGQAVEYALS